MNLSAIILGSAALLIHLYSEKYWKDDLAVTLDELDNDDNLPRIKTYDFIVVGGGAAGCVIAYRLSEHYTVLLLEAGGTPVPATRPSILIRSLKQEPSITYKYTSVPHTDLAPGNSGVVEHAEAKMLGGSMSHNGWVFNRGSPRTFDHWAILLSDSSFEYKNILKYFKKSENYRPAVSSGERGRGGLMTIERFTPPFLRTWFRAGAELGYPITFDRNSAQNESFTTVDVTEENGKRVLMKEKRVYGVAYTRHGIPQIAHASKEVIVSCGAYGSPILLMKSGIGPSEILRDAGIRRIADLPVGKTLNEHVGVPLEFSINDNGSLAPSYNTDLSEDSLREYHQNGGILGYPLAAAQAFLVSSRARTQGQLNWPDLHIAMRDLVFPPRIQGTRALILAVAITRRQTSGYLGLNITAFKSGIKLALAIVEDTTAFREIGGKYAGEKLPACSKFKFRTNEYWRCHIRQIGFLDSHTSGTCRMGFGLMDKHAVLDNEFNVLGISSLRVVDASAMPTSPSANPTAPVIMLAEKASDNILKCWK